MVFAGFSGFLHYLQLASHELATVGINVTKNEIQNPNLGVRFGCFQKGIKKTFSMGTNGPKLSSGPVSLECMTKTL